MAEDLFRDALVGEFFYEVLTDQFSAYGPVGDPSWYERTLQPDLAQQMEQLTLGDIIRLNTSIGDEIRRDVFRASPDAPF